MLIGLASKNSILIVEFANQLHAKGLSHHKAIVDAALTRLRPILMTSLAFIFGILPLAVAEGSWSEQPPFIGNNGHGRHDCVDNIEPVRGAGALSGFSNR